MIAMGHLTRTPELRYTASGTPVCSLGLAMNRRFKQGDDLKEEVCFLDVVLFGKTAEIAKQYLDKGDCAQFEGRIQQRRWETDQGDTRQKHELVADHLILIKTQKGPKPDDPQAPYS
jgi:single-strand DNA-binding protein